MNTKVLKQEKQKLITLLEQEGFSNYITNSNHVYISGDFLIRIESPRLAIHLLGTKEQKNINTEKFSEFLKKNEFEVEMFIVES